MAIAPLDHSFRYTEPHPEQETFFPQSFAPQFEERAVGIYQDEAPATGYFFPDPAAVANGRAKEEDVFQEEVVMETVVEKEEEVIVCGVEGDGPENFGDTLALFGQ
jgi:hypothetical protein